MELGLQMLERPLSEPETEGFGQADFPDGLVPSMARPAKKARTSMQMQVRKDDDSAQKWQDTWRAEQGTTNWGTVETMHCGLRTRATTEQHHSSVPCSSNIVPVLAHACSSNIIIVCPRPKA